MSLSPNKTSVMLLAAGHGKRMLPLTKHTPKPLLSVAGTPLIEHHLLRLAAAGFKHVVINHAHLGEQIVHHLGDGSRFGLHLTYSDESSSGALETAGGIQQALPLLNSDPFIVVNSDIFTQFNFTDLLLAMEHLGRLVLVPNPPQHPEGDFSIDESGMLVEKSAEGLSWTFSGIALYNKAFFKGLGAGAHALGPMFHAAIANRELEAVTYLGEWHDIGTPTRLAEINKQFKA